jgi:hypothetical protein
MGCRYETSRSGAASRRDHPAEHSWVGCGFFTASAYILVGSLTKPRKARTVGAHCRALPNHALAGSRVLRPLGADPIRRGIATSDVKVAQRMGKGRDICFRGVGSDLTLSPQASISQRTW